MAARWGHKLQDMFQQMNKQALQENKIIQYLYTVVYSYQVII